MKFTCTRENLIRALSITSHLSSKNISLPILNNILIKTTDSQVQFSVTNLEIALTATIRAKVEEAGSFTVPAKVISDVVSLHDDGQFELTVKNDSELELGGVKGKVIKIKGMSAEEYPIIPKIEGGTKVGVDPLLLKRALSQVVFAVAKNEIRPELSGVFVSLSQEEKKLTLAATDSFRLAEKKIKIGQVEKSFESIIPARALFEVIRVLGVVSPGIESGPTNLIFSENQFGLESEGFTLVTRCVEGKYPDYTQIIPAQFGTRVRCSLEEFTKNIKAASLFTTSGVSAVTLGVAEGEKSLSIAASNAQVGEYNSDLEVDLEGTANSIVLNHRYILDGLNAIDSEKLFIGFVSGNAPCLFRADAGADEYLYIVMPIKQ